jgi:hypothetical protein
MLNSCKNLTDEILEYQKSILDISLNENKKLITYKSNYDINELSDRRSKINFDNNK